MKEDQSKRYEACFELYKRYAGRKLTQIEREMRALGFADFHRRILYGRKENGTWKAGWIEKFGWREQLLTAMPPDVRKGYAFPTDHNKESRGYASAPINRGKAADHSSNPSGKAQPFRTSYGQSPNEGFPAWLKQVSPDYTWTWKHQQYIYRHLQRITNGENKRLMIFLPPRHGKSELVTVRYAGWRLWNDPKMKIIVSSYNQKLADKFSRSIRKLLSEEEDKQSALQQQVALTLLRRLRRPMCGKAVPFRKLPKMKKEARPPVLASVHPAITLDVLAA